MQRLTDVECEVLELLQKAQLNEMNKGKILSDIDRDNSLISKSLDRLERRNYVTSKEEYGFTLYFISENNRQLKARKVMCPKCGNVRRVFSDEQTIAICKNRDCKTPAGNRRMFWVRKRSVKLLPGQIEHLNLA